MDNEFRLSKSARRRSLVRQVATIILVIAVDVSWSPQLSGQVDSTWVAVDTGDWFDTQNWDAVVPNAAGDIGRFQRLSENEATINLNAPATLGQLHLASVSQITLSGTGPLIFDHPTEPARLFVTRIARRFIEHSIEVPVTIAADQTLTADILARNSLEITGSFSPGSGNLVKTNGGDLALAGASPNWAGEIQVDQGRLLVQHADALGNTEGQTLVNGGTVEVNSLVSEPFTLQAGSLETTVSFLNLNGPINLPTDNTASVRGPFDLRGGTTGKGALRLIANGNGAISASSLPLAHQGGVILSSGETNRNFATFAADNTYTGKTQVTNVTLQVRTPSGLGSAADGTVLDHSTLQLHGGSAESVTASNSVLGLWSAEAILPELTATGTFTLQSSTIDTSGQFRGAETYRIQNPVVLAGGINEITTSMGGMHLQSGIVGSGDLLLNPSRNYPIEIAGALTHDGSLEVRGGPVRMTAPNAYSKDVLIRNGGQMVIESRQSFGTISTGTQSDPCCSRFGTIEVAPGSSLIADAVNIFQGSLQGNVQTSRPLQFRGFASGRTVRNLQSVPTIEVHGGELTLDDSDMSRPVTDATISILRETGASVFLDRDTVTDASFKLNNGSGFNFGGALRTENDTNGNPTITVRGNIDLGKRGAHIGGSDDIIVEGQITGGDLHLGRMRATPSLIFSTSELAYFGKTNIYSGSIALRDAGRLEHTSGIDIYIGGALFIGDSNSAGATSDRVADDIPISLFGGELSGWPVEAGVNSIERVGRVHAARGLSSLHGSGVRLRTFQGAMLAVGELERSSGAVITIQPRSEPSFAAGTFGETSLELENPPEVINGILPAWITEGINFTTLSSAGLVVGYQGPFESFENADSTSIVRPPSSDSILTADKVVHAVYAFGNTGAVDLNGHTVTVGSGGISGANMSNGTIQPGEHSGGELIFFGGSTINVDLVDGETPTSVTYVGDVELRGTSTYTGTTYVVGHGGDDVRVRQASALPTGGDIEISGFTNLFLRDLSGNTAYQLGSIALRDGGALGAQCCGNGDTVTATDILIEEGRLSVPLVGNTIITKRTEGLGRITRASPGFSGRVEVQEGSLLIGESGDGFTSLGSSEVVVHPDANLTLSPVSQFLADAAPAPKIRLAGGAIFGTGHVGDDRVSLRGTLEVTQSSRIYLLDGLEGDPQVSNLTFDGKIRVAAGQSLSVIGIAESSRGLTVSEGIELEPGAILGGTGSIRSNLEIAGGAILSPGLQNEDSSLGTLHVSLPNLVSELEESSLTWGENGRYRWEINNVDGLAGGDFGEGWDLINAGGDLTIEATAENPFVIEVVSLGEDNERGRISNLLTNSNYRWKIAEVAQVNAFAGTISGFDASKFSVDVSMLRDFYPMVREEDFFLERVGPEIFLRGAIVPEPAAQTLLLGVTLTILARRIR